MPHTGWRRRVGRWDSNENGNGNVRGKVEAGSSWTSQHTSVKERAEQPEQRRRGRPQAGRSRGRKESATGRPLRCSRSLIGDRRHGGLRWCSPRPSTGGHPVPNRREKVSCKTDPGPRGASQRLPWNAQMSRGKVRNTQRERERENGRGGKKTLSSSCS